MLSPIRRAVTLPRLGIAAVIAVMLSFLPLMQFSWLPSAITENVLAHFEAAGAQELPAPGPGETITTDRRVTSESGVDPFTAVGLTLTEMPTEPVFARTHAVGGDWSDWREFDLTTTNGPEMKQQVVAEEPIWVKSADGYEIDVPSAIADTTKVVLIRDGVHRVVSTATPLAGAETPPFGVHSRAEWGARPYNGTPDYGSTINFAVVHHSDSGNDYAPADVPSILRSIQAFHMDSNGWADIGYNFVVDKYGGIWEGRAGGIDRPVIGAHAAGFNTNSTGVMVIGDYTAAQPTPAAIESVSEVVGWKMSLFGSDPAGQVTVTSGGSPKYAAGAVVTIPRVVGHQDVGLTACPGSIEGYLGQIRARAQQYKDVFATTRNPFGSVDSAVGGNGSITLTGWAIDPSAAGAPSSVRVNTSTGIATVTAAQPRPDVGAAYPTYGSNHGFTATLSGVPPGIQQVCAAALSDPHPDRWTGLGCWWVMVNDASGMSPTGYLDQVTGGPGSLSVHGAVRDPSAPDAPLAVDVELNGTVVSTVQTSGGPGVFSAQLSGLIGQSGHVCVIAHNVGAGSNTRFACGGTVISSSMPIGHWDWMGSNPAGDIGFFGWAYDPEVVGWTQVLMTVDGRRYVLPADQQRPDIASAVPAAYGTAHGFSATINVGKGNHSVCSYPIDFPSGQLGSFGCRNIVIK